MVVEGLPLRVEEEHDDESPVSLPKTKMCNKKLAGRRPGTLPHHCTCTLGPDQYLRCRDGCPPVVTSQRQSACPEVRGASTLCGTCESKRREGKSCCLAPLKVLKLAFVPLGFCHRDCWLPWLWQNLPFQLLNLLAKAGPHTAQNKTPNSVNCDHWAPSHPQFLSSLQSETPLM